MRETLSRSQSQSKEDPDSRWANRSSTSTQTPGCCPPTESEYRQGIGYFESYAKRLADTASPDAQFYARADNLRYWLGTVQRPARQPVQRLSASVGKTRLNVDLPGSAAHQSTPAAASSNRRRPG